MPYNGAQLVAKPRSARTADPSPEFISVMPTPIALSTIALAVLCAPSSPASRDATIPHVEHLRASTFSRSAQFEPAITRTSEGELIAVWTSRRQSNGHQGIYLQRFDGRGVAIGGEREVHRFIETGHQSPTIAAIPAHAGGGVVIAWDAHGQDGDRGSIIARVLRPADLRADLRIQSPGGDAAASSERCVNERTEGEQHSPVVAVAPDGTIWFAWIGEGRRVALRGLSPSGEFAPERTLAEGWHLRSPSIAARADGSLVVTWTDDDRAGNASVRGMVLTAAGAAILPSAWQEPNTLADDAYEASVVDGPHGTLVTFSSLRSKGETAGHMAFALRLDERGCPIGEPTPLLEHAQSGFQLGVQVGARWSESLAAAPFATESGFGVALTVVPKQPDDASIAHSGRELAIVRLDADARLIGAARALTDGLPGEQMLRAAAGTTRAIALDHGGAAIAWNGDAGLGDPDAVHLSLLTAQPTMRAAGERAGIDPATAVPAPRDDDAEAKPHIPPRFDARGVEDAARTIEVNDLGVGFDAIIDTGWTPPDPILAVGPEHLVAMTNGRISIFDKSGAQLFTDEIEGSGGFWGSLGATGFVFDPECIYDPIHGRFWAIASEAAPAGKSFILIAVSDDANAPGTWFKYRLETTVPAGATFDSPNLSVDDEAVYVTGDGSAGNYQIFIWDKASLLAGQPPAIAKQLVYVTGPESCGIPPVMDPNAPGLYLLEHKEAASNTLVKFLCLTNPLTTPTLVSTELTVPAYGPPEDAPQQGTTIKIENFEARFWSVDYRNGSFWATHHINASRVVVRWYEFRMNGWPTSGSLPAVRQQGTVDLGGTVRTFYSAIGADDAGNAALTFARSSPSEFISLCTTYRTASDPLGTMRTPTIVKTNPGPYTESNRWGDYAAVRRDPAAPGTAPRFWANHEYAVGPSSWRTWIQALDLPAPSPDLDGDGSVAAEDLAILLGVWGAAGGSHAADLDGDGSVGASDLAILLGAWSV